MGRLGIIFLFVYGFAFFAVPQGDVKQEDVNKAIDNGVEYLLKQVPEILELQKSTANPRWTGELVLLTLIHGGADKKGKEFNELLEFILDDELRCTYNVAIQAIALEKLDKQKYFWRIAQCAQFLVDNQKANGQWSYGQPTQIPRNILKLKNIKPKKSGTKVKRNKIIIRQRRVLPGTGDNSNSQYAALGLRACIDAGCVIERKVIKRALNWWKTAQNLDGGWNYTTPSAQNPSYGSMTVAGIAAICIYLYYLKKDMKVVKNNKYIKKGVKWLVKNFAVDKNPGKKTIWHYYYLYGLERAGALYDTEVFGTHRWYQEGARYLLKNQESDGSWKRSVQDTCFAILFLRRATKKLEGIETGKRTKKKKRR
jgi:hypothetical protein